MGDRSAPSSPCHQTLFTRRVCVVSMGCRKFPVHQSLTLHNSLIQPSLAITWRCLNPTPASPTQPLRARVGGRRCAPHYTLYTRVHTFTYFQSPTGGVARHPSVLYAGHGRSLCTLVATIFARFPTGGVARHPNVRRSWRLREGRRGTRHAHTAQSISILRSHTHARGGVFGIGVSLGFACLLAVSALRGCGL